jgi:tetratricopeptide (TPR) repeat protein
MLKQTSERSKEKLFLLGIFFLAFTLRLVYLLQVKGNPHFFSPTMDQLYHDIWAQNIAGGNWIGGKVFFRAPLYAYFLAIVYKIFGHNYIIPRLIQHLIGSFSCILVYLVAKRVFNGSTIRRFDRITAPSEVEGGAHSAEQSRSISLPYYRKVAIVAALLAATYGMFFYFEDELLLDSFLVFFDLLLILLLLRAKNNPKILNWFVCGLILGFSAITRPNILFFIPFVWLWIFLVFFKAKRLKGVSTFCIIFLIGSALVIFPVALRNYLVGKDLVLIASQGGINFYIGNNRNSDGMSAIFYKEDWQYRDFEQVAENETGRSLKPTEISNFYYKKGIKFFLDEPEKALKLWMKKLYVFWNKFEVSNNQDIYFFRRYSSLIRILPIGFWFIGPLGLLGMALSLLGEKERVNIRKSILLPILFVFSYMLTVVMFFVTARFRLPVLPFLIIFSAFALVWFWEKFSRRELRNASLFFLLLFPFFILTNSNIYHLSQGDFSQAYFSLGNVDLKAGKLDQALQEYDVALKRNPNLARAHLNKGIIFLRKNEYDQAEEEFHQELEINPNDDKAYNNLSAVYRLRGLYDQAIEAAQKAVNLKAYYPEAYMNLALAYKEKGDYQKAKDVLSLGMKKIQPFLDANLLMGEILQEEGKLDLAMAEYRKITDQSSAKKDVIYDLETLFSKGNPYNLEDSEIRAKAHFNLGTIYVQKGRIDLAESHLETAIALKPDFAEAFANLGTLYDNIGRHSEAIIQLQKAISLDPQNAIYHYNLGLAYAKSNRLEEAKEELEQCLKIEPDFKEAQEKLLLADSLLKSKIP